jgi:hypothetical protein
MRFNVLKPSPRVRDCCRTHQIWKVVIMSMTDLGPMNIDLIALKCLTEAFDRFIGECMDENGKPKEPSRQALMKARACLPPSARHTLTKPKEKA